MKNKQSKSLLAAAFSFLNEILFNPEKISILMVLIIFAELVLNAIIVKFVPYTEIDWKAYMQEVEGYLNGSTNYHELKGDTGPLVYPGGFVYLYSILYHVTDKGTDLNLAQQIFALLYLIQLVMVFIVYREVASRVNFEPYLLIFLSLTGYRVHSIFSLRLFNDGPANIFAWISFYCFMTKKWTLGSVLYSLSISIKMNNLLFAPAIGVIFVRNLSISKTIQNLGICALVQIIVGAEFLLTYPWEYLSRAFEFSRKFFFKWTVNFRFLPEEIFLDSRLHLALLALHLTFLVLFCAKKWLPKEFGSSLLRFPISVFKTITGAGKSQTCPLMTLTMILTSNFIGMVFARSLHYQFYVWYYHSLPFLVHLCGLGRLVSIAILLGIEYCWNVYPSTNFSSGLLVSLHIFLLFKLYFAPWPKQKKKSS